MVKSAMKSIYRLLLAYGYSRILHVPHDQLLYMHKSRELYRQVKGDLMTSRPHHVATAVLSELCTLVAEAEYQ